MRPASPLAAARVILAVWFAFALLLIALPAGADELTLKDGTKITGTIVGFEAKSFRVKTSYGFAEVERDQVVSIAIAEAATPAPAPAEKPKPAAPAPPVLPAPAAAKPAPPAKPAPSVSTNAAAKAKPAPEPKLKPAAATASATNPAAAPAPRASAANASSAPAPAGPRAAAPVASAGPGKPAPEAVREEVSGNTYVNQTYRFEMFKPPDWEIIDGARSILPGAIAAMGTDDASTYLLVGQEQSAKSLAGAMDATEDRLQNVMDNYRQTGEERVAVSGSSAIARHFRGSVDQHDWSGVVVLVPHGSHIYAIFGMTRADSDLVQIEENVIARTISSFEFTGSN